ncbi:histidine phosphatase family protein [Nocardioides solisilvae]|uniref:histidine phosphatase family protein n=1 Tax=Nocardioides solisilvae TaxID=1542435 RepID=UPI000D745DC9|nr:histidine phosphatase family protein [Nocardioides solisilvae]
MRPRWSSGPAGLVLVRHGESEGNLADARAREQGAERLELDARDADVPLSAAGREQGGALNRWLHGLADDDRPTLVVSSPYERAAQTARLALEGLDVPLEMDERLRERDLGLFDGMTGKGIRARHPEEAARRDRLGKFWYQPPSGESWADVVLRVRSLLADLRHGHDGARLWLFTHQAVIMSFRHALEDLTEEELLEVDRRVQIPNASLTGYRREGDLLQPVSFADTSAVDADAGAEVTREPAQGGRGDGQA